MCFYAILFCCSIAQVLKNHSTEWKLTKEERLTPVLAVGSNAAPAQLARKFPADLFPDGVVIPVLRCVLPDFDVVYAPLISSYGSCTGTAEHATVCSCTSSSPLGAVLSIPALRSLKVQGSAARAAH